METYIFDNGGVTILALLRDLASPPGASAASKMEALDLTLPRVCDVYDVRALKRLRHIARLRIKVGPTAPLVLALSNRPLPRSSLSGPISIRVGQTAHVAIVEPGGNVVPYYSGNLLAPAGTTSFTLPLAVNDKPGLWTIQARNVLTGATAITRLQVQP